MHTTYDQQSPPCRPTAPLESTFWVCCVPKMFVLHVTDSDGKSILADNEQRFRCKMDDAVYMYVVTQKIWYSTHGRTTTVTTE
jgi:hypothetical protein